MARKMTPSELDLVEALLADHPDHALPRDHLAGLDVEEMKDGGTGSLKFLASTSPRMGYELSELAFTDVDSTYVSAALNFDPEGLLYELDIFKGDSSPLIAIPSRQILATSGPTPRTEYLPVDSPAKAHLVFPQRRTLVHKARKARIWPFR